LTYDKGKIIRYGVIASLYNLIVSIIVYSADWINDEFLNFEWQNWDLASWWLFVAVNLVLFGTLLFLAPYFERLLYFKLDKIQKKLQSKKGNN
jgi:hypothetical protein